MVFSCFCSAFSARQKGRRRGGTCVRTGCTLVWVPAFLWLGTRKHSWEHTWGKTAASRLTPGTSAGSLDLAQPDEVMAAVSPVLFVRVTQSLWGLADPSPCAAAPTHGSRGRRGSILWSSNWHLNWICSAWAGSSVVSSQNSVSHPRLTWLPRLKYLFSQGNHTLFSHFFYLELHQQS